MARLLLVGFLSLLAQVALLRELDVAFYGVELVYPMALAGWLLGTAAGALVSHRVLKPSSARFSWLLLFIAVLLPLDVAFLRGSRILLGGVQGAYLPLLDQVLVLVASLLPASFQVGLLFQWAARLSIAGGSTLAVAYAVESAGSVAGGLAATVLLALGLPNFTTVVACCLGAAMASIAWARSRVLHALAALVLAALLAGLWLADDLDRRMTSWNHPQLVVTRDSPYGRVTVTSLEEQVSVFENDSLFFSMGGTAAEEFVNLAALQHPMPRRVLVLGGGISGIVEEVLKHGPERVDTVELNRILVDLVLPRLPADIRGSIEARDVRTIHEDPRRFLGRAGKYDLILVGMSDPSSGQANRFYTQEFFDLCRSRLEPGGILAFRVGSAENFLPPHMARRLASIYRAVRSVFPDVLILVPPGATNVVLASGKRLSRDPKVLAERFEKRRIAARLVSTPYIDYVYTNDRLPEILRIVESEDAPANTDAEPICFQYSVLIWVSKFLPQAALLDISAALRGSRELRWGLCAGLPALFLLARFRPGLRRALLAAVAGCTGMVLETILILFYQVKSGVLFQDIGFLLTVFMAGLAAGAFFLDRLGRRPGLGPGSRRLWGLLLLLGFCALSGLVAFTVGRAQTGGLLETAVGLAITGFLVAGLFAHVSLHGVEDQGGVVSPLYAADLVGGCLAAFLGTLLVIPALGLAATAGWTAFLAVAAVLLL